MITLCFFYITIKTCDQNKRHIELKTLCGYILDAFNARLD